MFKKIFLKIKRYFFYKCCGYYPEDFAKLVFIQKYLEEHECDNKNYNDYLMEQLNAKQ